MWSSPSLHIYIKNASTFGRTLTEHLLNAGTRPQTCKRARVSPRNWVGQKEKRKRNQDRACATGREEKLWRRKSFYTEKSPRWWGDRPGHGELWSLWRKHSNRFAEGKPKRERYRCCRLALPSLTSSSTGVEVGLDAETWALGDRLRGEHSSWLYEDSQKV